MLATEIKTAYSIVLVVNSLWISPIPLVASVAQHQSKGKIIYYGDEFSLMPNIMTYFTIQLVAKSPRQNCAFKADEMSFMEKMGRFLFLKEIAIKILLVEETEE